MSDPTYHTEEVTVERVSDDIGSWQTVALQVCDDCGAYVCDTVTHSTWHATVSKTNHGHSHMTLGKIV